MGKSLYTDEDKKDQKDQKGKNTKVVEFAETHTPNSRYLKTGNEQGEPTTEAKEGEEHAVVDAVHPFINEPSISDIVKSVSSPAPEEQKPKQVSIYLEPDIKEAFVAYGKLKGKGKRSELVNKLLRQALKDFLPH